MRCGCTTTASACRYVAMPAVSDSALVSLARLALPMVGSAVQRLGQHVIAFYFLVRPGKLCPVMCNCNGWHLVCYRRAYLQLSAPPQLAAAVLVSSCPLCPVACLQLLADFVEGPVDLNVPSCIYCRSRDAPKEAYKAAAAAGGEASSVQPTYLVACSTCPLAVHPWCNERETGNKVGTAGCCSIICSA
jgi:hypothetical protein